VGPEPPLFTPRRSDVPPGWANHGWLTLAHRLSGTVEIFLNLIGDFLLIWFHDFGRLARSQPNAVIQNQDDEDGHNPDDDRGGNLRWLEAAGHQRLI
jgi:hypothetical protein